MSDRTVSQCMAQRQLVSLPPEASVWEAACTMTKANCGSVLIIEQTGAMLGILTERDLMTRVLAKARGGTRRKDFGRVLGTRRLAARGGSGRQPGPVS